jgi:hypothetical protein
MIKGVVTEYSFSLFLNIDHFLVLRELKINEEKIILYNPQGSKI